MGDRLRSSLADDVVGRDGRCVIIAGGDVKLAMQLGVCLRRDRNTPHGYASGRAHGHRQTDGHGVCGSVATGMVTLDIGSILRSHEYASSPP